MVRTHPRARPDQLPGNGICRDISRQSFDEIDSVQRERFCATAQVVDIRQHASLTQHHECHAMFGRNATNHQCLGHILHLARPGDVALFGP
jgi:hypothetical protein